MVVDTLKSWPAKCGKAQKDEQIKIDKVEPLNDEDWGKREASNIGITSWNERDFKQFTETWVVMILKIQQEKWKEKETLEEVIEYAAVFWEGSSEDVDR